ncbi:MAG: sodium/proton-translocating pyrophosphatase [Candidatus Peregrinibacteria bacterium]
MFDDLFGRISSLLPVARSFSHSLLALLGCSLCALVAALLFRAVIGLKGGGTQRMQMAADILWRMTGAFTRRVALTGIGLSLLCAAVLYGFLDGAWSALAGGGGAPLPLSSGSFLLGAMTFLLFLLLFPRLVAAASVSIAQAARTGLTESFLVAFRSAAALALMSIGVTLSVFVASLWALISFGSLGIPNTLPLSALFVAGILFAALLLAVAILGAASAEDPVGDLFAALPDGARMCSGVKHIFEHLLLLFAAFTCVSLVGVDTALLGSGFTGFQAKQESILLLIFAVAGWGMIAGILGMVVVRVRTGETRLQGPLKNGLFLSATLLIIGMLLFSYAVLPAVLRIPAFLSLLSGVLFAMLLGIVAEHATSDSFASLRRLGERSSGDPIAFGDGLDHLALRAFLPLALLFLAFIAFPIQLAGPGGFFLAVVGAVSLLPSVLPVAFFAPLTSGASAIVSVSLLPKQVTTRSVVLSHTGVRLRAVTHIIFLGVMTAVSVMLLLEMVLSSNLSDAVLGTPTLVLWFLLGCTVMIRIAGWLQPATSPRAPEAGTISPKQIPLLEGSRDVLIREVLLKPMRTATWRALRHGVLFLFCTIALPLLIGLTLGCSALIALMAGAVAVASGTACIAVIRAGILSSIGTFIETGNLGGEGSQAHRAFADVSRSKGSLAASSSFTLLFALLLSLMTSVLFAGLFTPTGML